MCQNNRDFFSIKLSNSELVLLPEECVLQQSALKDNSLLTTTVNLNTN